MGILPELFSKSVEAKDAVGDILLPEDQLPKDDAGEGPDPDDVEQYSAEPPSDRTKSRLMRPSLLAAKGSYDPLTRRLERVLKKN